jgi:DNA mismatch repair protein MutS
VIRDARKRLKILEQQSIHPQHQADLFTPGAADEPDEPPKTAHPVLEELARLDPDSLSPREALEYLYSLKKRVPSDHPG